jgi:phage terminase large subunit-like protein
MDPAEDYARRVTRGEIIACKWVKLAAKRHLDDLVRQGTAGFPYVWDRLKADRISTFVQLMPHVKGPLAGDLIRLEPWQQFILRCVFGWVHKTTGFRRFRRVYIEVPRGNAKSTLSSALGLYMLAADDEGGAEIYAAATTKEQAKIVMRDAQQMGRKADDFREHFGVEVTAHAVVQQASGSRFLAVSSDEGTLDGFNVHLAIIDELHAHKTRGVYDVMETGIGKRTQSLLWAISTAGSNRSGICYEVRTYLTKVLQGIAKDDAFFGIIYTIDDGDNWHDPKSWEKANPNWGVSVQPDVIAGLAAKAMQMPAAQANFQTKHLDVWVAADQAWMDMRAWDRCADTSLEIEDFEGEDCIAALDLASKVDLAAKMRMFRRIIDEREHFYLFGQYYLPEAAVLEARNSQYQGWQIDGRLITTPGDVLDFERVKQDVLDDADRFQLLEIAYDPWQALNLAQQLQAEGATVIEYRNTVANFSAPMKELQALALQGRLHHDGDPVLTWAVSNVVCHTDAKENIYPRKERPENKIDPVVAAIMALGRWMAARAQTQAQQAFVEL